MAIWQSEQFPDYYVYWLGTLSQKIFWKWINFWIRHSKKFHCPLSTISLHYQTAIDQKLTVLHQLLSWTEVGPSKCPIDKKIGSQDHLTVWGVPSVPCVLSKNSFTENFSKWINFRIRHCKKFYCPLIKVSLHYQTVIDQSLTILYQLFSWNSVGSSKCPIDKMIGSQDHLTVWAVFWLLRVLAKNSFTEYGATQLLLQSDHCINPTIWYLVLGLNFKTSILVIISYHKGYLIRVI